MLKNLIIIFYLCFTILLWSTLSCYMHADVKQIDSAKLQKSDKLSIVLPTKAHLLNGSLIVFKNGCTLENDTLKGEGIKYDLTRTHRSSYAGQTTTVPIDSVICLKRYRLKTEWYSTFIHNPLYTAVVAGFVYNMVASNNE